MDRWIDEPHTLIRNYCDLCHQPCKCVVREKVNLLLVKQQQLAGYLFAYVNDRAAISS